MVDVFISYSSKDRDKARALAKALEARSLTVWWDRSILPGESFDDAIERAIADSRCLVVLWSNHSVQSRWVRNEASEGERRGILVPALLEEAPIPLQFRSMQAADLRNWDIVSPHSELEALTKAIQQTIGRSVGARPDAVFKTEQSPPEAPPKTESIQPIEIRNVITPDDRVVDHYSVKASPQPQTSLAGMGLVAVAVVGILLAGLLFMNLKSPGPIAATYSNPSNSTETATGSKLSTTVPQSANAEKALVKTSSSPHQVSLPTASASIGTPASTNPGGETNKTTAAVRPASSMYKVQPKIDLASPPKASASIGTSTYTETARESSKTPVATRSEGPVGATSGMGSNVTRSSTNCGVTNRESVVPTISDERASDLYRMFLSQYEAIQASPQVLSGKFKLIYQKGDKRRLLNGALAFVLGCTFFSGSMQIGVGT